MSLVGGKKYTVGSGNDVSRRALFTSSRYKNATSSAVVRVASERWEGGFS